ncbi:unnamed protein product [Ambrosiozyma monospora]|uniref:Unnamed protein product n=1 Tax=Ambrosiozyma monospora TaxID=43982 RepID=A0ACB5U2J6_AMBMO|nr:unnamed protein product [Ambrosiozyma monospora]
MFQELRRHKPSVLYIPDLLSFMQNITPSIKATITNMTRNMSPNDQVLILGMVEESDELNYESMDLLPELKSTFQFNNRNIVEIKRPSVSEIEEFFKFAFDSITLTPIEFDDLSVRPKRKLKKLKVIKMEEKPKADNFKKEKEQAMHDMRLKNLLMVKLSVLMETCKNRFRRFRKPIIDDSELIHLFGGVPNPAARYQLQNDKILDTSTGKLFYNMDLEIVEERLWNGFYSEPKQFADDIKSIVSDSETANDRERITRSKEMLAHIMVGLDEIRVQTPQLLEEWKQVRLREKKRQLEQCQKLKEQELEREAKAMANGLQALAANGDANVEGAGVAPIGASPAVEGVAADAIEPQDGDKVQTQTQTQAQLQPNQNKDSSLEDER